MTTRYLFAVLHLLALAIGIAAVYARGLALRKLKAPEDLSAVFHADGWYGLAALIWVGSGLMRAFGGLEKGTEFYLESHWFMGKMGLFALVFALELFPMITFINWRGQVRKGRVVELARAPLLARLTFLQLPLLVLIVFMAAAMARGL